jgi:hypothetical protein
MEFAIFVAGAIIPTVIPLGILAAIIRRQGRRGYDEERESLQNEGYTCRDDTSSPSGQETYKTRAEELEQVIVEMRLPRLKELLVSGVDLDHRFNGGKTPLHLACESGSLDVCNLLLNRGADLNATDDTNMTPLLCAVQAGRVNITRNLIAKGIKESAADDRGRTATMIATEKGDLWMLQELFASQKWLPKGHDQAINIAMAHSNLKIVDFLQNAVTSVDSDPGTVSGDIALKSFLQGSQKLYSIISNQISKPTTPTEYINSTMWAAKEIPGGQYAFTPEISHIFSMLYQAIFEGKVKGEFDLVEAHLTVLKIIAKTLG